MTTEKKVHKIGAGYGDEIVVFHLRSISLGEENQYTNRFLDQSVNESPESKAKKEFDIFVDSIASWSEQGPCTVKETANGLEFTPMFPDAETPADAVRSYFQVMDTETARIALQVVLAFRQKLQPKVLFY